MFTVQPPLTTYERHTKDFNRFWKHIGRHFNGAFYKLGIGEYSWVQKGFVLYIFVLCGGATFGALFIWVIKKCIKESEVEELDPDDVPLNETKKDK